MPSPAKKRKLNDTSKTSVTPSKGLEYFFNKQKQNNSDTGHQVPVETEVGSTDTLTDEELARKLQEEWDQEARDEAQNGNEKDEKFAGDLAESSSQSDSTGKQDGRAPVPTTGPIPAVEQTDKGGLKKTLTLQSSSISEDSINATVPLDESPLNFDPSKYISQLQQSWSSEAGDASYALLTRCFVLVSSTTSRIKTVDTLVNCLRLLIEGDPSSLLPAVSYACVRSKPIVLTFASRYGWPPTPSHLLTYHLNLAWGAQLYPKH